MTEYTVLIRQRGRSCHRVLPRANPGEWRPSLGTQNHMVDFILADPELRAAVTHWGRLIERDEVTTEPPPRLPAPPDRR